MWFTNKLIIMFALSTVKPCLFYNSFLSFEKQAIFVRIFLSQTLHFNLHFFLPFDIFLLRRILLWQDFSDESRIQGRLLYTSLIKYLRKYAFWSSKNSKFYLFISFLVYLKVKCGRFKKAEQRITSWSKQKLSFWVAEWDKVKNTGQDSEFWFPHL